MRVRTLTSLIAVCAYGAVAFAQGQAESQTPSPSSAPGAAQSQTQSQTPSPSSSPAAKAANTVTIQGCIQRGSAAAGTTTGTSGSSAAGSNFILANAMRSAASGA